MPRSIGLLAIALAVAGCAPSGPPVAPAEAVVTLYGKPGGNLIVYLTPVKSGEGKVLSASGLTDASGRCVFQCDDGRAGAPIGRHKVMVVDKNLESEDEHKPGAKRPVNRVPPLFQSATTTPVEINIEAGKKDYEISIPPKK